VCIGGVNRSMDAQALSAQASREQDHKALLHMLEQRADERSVEVLAQIKVLHDKIDWVLERTQLLPPSAAHKNNSRKATSTSLAPPLDRATPPPAPSGRASKRTGAIGRSGLPLHLDSISMVLDADKAIYSKLIEHYSPEPSPKGEREVPCLSHHLYVPMHPTGGALSVSHITFKPNGTCLVGCTQVL
jgi:hypothetical protein